MLEDKLKELIELYENKKDEYAGLAKRAKEQAGRETDISLEHSFKSETYRDVVRDLKKLLKD